MLRRLEKRILVDLPTFDARKAMFKHHLPRIVNPSEGGLELLSDLDYDLLALVSYLLDLLDGCKPYRIYPVIRQGFLSL